MPVFTSKKALSDEGLSSEARLGERKTSYLGAECLSLRLLPSAKSTSLVRGRLSKAPATAGTPLKTAPSKRELSAAKLLTEGVLSLYAKKHHPAGWCFFAVVILEKSYFFMASSTATATATVAPTIGLLPMPRKPIISTSNPPVGGFVPTTQGFFGQQTQLFANQETRP